MNPLDLAQYILHKYPNITHVKLQKLLYYLKVWGVVAGHNIVEGDFEKWAYGPVSPSVYQEYKLFGRNPIPSPDTPLKIPDVTTQELIDFILEAYMPYQAFELSAMTHRELPWDQISDNEVISDSQIQAIYVKLPFAQNFNPFDLTHKPYYVVQSNGWYAYVMDMNAKDMQRSTQFSSYAAYKESRERTKRHLEK